MDDVTDDLFAAYRRVRSSQPRFTVVAVFWAGVGVESTWWASSGQWSLDQLHNIIGFQLEPKKRKHGEPVNEGFSVTCDLSLLQSRSEISLLADVAPHG